MGSEMCIRDRQNTNLMAYRAEVEKIAQRDKRIVQAIMDGYASETLKEEMNALVARKSELESLIAGTSEAPVLLHPRMADRYREEVSQLVETLKNDDSRAEAIEMIRALIDKIVLVPDPDSNGFLIDLYGDLAGILNISLGHAGEDTESGIDPRRVQLVVGLNNPSGDGVQDKMVGPDGIEPTTSTMPLHRIASQINSITLQQ